MINRKEFDEKIKNKLIERYGFSEFKAGWQDISKLIDLPLAKAKYHIYKLESQGFLKVIEKSQRSEGHTSPNVIRILAEPINNELIDSQSDGVFDDIKKRLDDLQSKAREIQIYKDEIQRLTIENQKLDATNKRLYQEALELREKVYELTRFG